jgi:hypothetical protein
MTAVELDQLRALRARAQLLAGSRPERVAEAVGQVVAVQAQAVAAARLAIRARTTGLCAGDVDEAATSGAVVRTWAMRGTLHMLRAEDVRWINRLLGPVFARAGRRRREQLGLDDATCERALAVMAEVLSRSAPLSRAQLMATICARGVRVNTSTQAPAHLLMFAANTGLICRGPELERDEPSYLLLERWAPPGPRLERAEAAAELARRYLAGYGPADAADFAAWSGLPATEVRQAWAAIADELRPVSHAGATLATLSPDVASPVATPAPRLLGRFDTLLLGYRSRELILAPEFARRVQAGGGMITATVLIGGEVRGTWRLDRDRSRAIVTIEPFQPLAPGEVAALEQEAAQVAAFLGRSLVFRLQQPT